MATDSAPASPAQTPAPNDPENAPAGEKKPSGFMGIISALMQGDLGGVIQMIMEMFSPHAAQETSANTIPTNGDLKAVVQDAKAPNIPQMEVTSGLLSSMGSVAEGKQVAVLPAVAFFDGKEYKSGVEHVTPDSLKQVSIGTPDGQTHYYKQVDALDGVSGTQTGLKATAYVETDKDGKTLTNKDGKTELLLGFSGYTGDLKDGSAQTAALNSVIDGKLNPQAIEAAAFTDRAIKDMGGKDKISGVIFGAHSLGASNALAAQVTSDLEGVKSETTLLIEPAAATQEARKISEAMQDSKSGFSQQLQGILKENKLATDQDAAAKVTGEVAAFQQDINDKTISIRAIKNGANGPEGTIVANLIPGHGMDWGMQQEKTRQFNRGIAEAIGGAVEPENLMKDVGNAPLGKALFQDVTNNPQVASATSEMAKLDPNHQLANILNGEMGAHKNAILALGKTLNSFNVAGGTHTAGPNGAASNINTGQEKKTEIVHT